MSRGKYLWHILGLSPTASVAFQAGPSFSLCPKYKRWQCGNSQATAICARLAFFGVDESVGEGSSMISLESHGTSDEDAAGDLDHRDVVRSKCWQARA